VYKYTAANGTITFTDKKPANQTYKTLLFTCYACAVNSDINWHNTPLFQDKYQSEITAASKTHQIPQALIRAVIHAESAFKPDAISKTGAIGLMQLMPQTAKQLGVSKPQQVAANIDGGTKYLAQMLKQFQGNIQLATAAYNAGPTTVKKYNGIPPYPETKAYVERVKILHRRYRL
jgi:soluble lytic murein transglycosylase-like protein